MATLGGRVSTTEDAQRMEVVEMDFHSLCRLCGNMNINLLPVHSDDGSPTELMQKIADYLGISISPEDILPKKLCIHCSNTLSSWHSFYVSCQETNSKFHSMVSFTKTEEVLETLEDDDPPDFGEDVEVEEHIEFLEKEECEEIEENLDFVAVEEVEEDLGDARRRRLRRRKSRRRLKKSSCCSYCSLTFKDDALLKRHIKAKHIDRVFLCDQCENYVDRDQLIRHMVSHLELLPEKLKQKCSLCPKEFCSKTGLTYHLKQFHEKIRDQKCQICGKSFGCRYTLNNHVRSLHGSDRDFPCKDCQAAFKTQSSLYIHRKVVHDDAKRFSCELCYKKFAFQKQLKVHLMSHSKEKIHFCDICRKGFSVRNNLTKHLRTHSDVADFKCHICYFATTQKRYLAEHMKRKHLTCLARK